MLTTYYSLAFAQFLRNFDLPTRNGLHFIYVGNFLRCWRKKAPQKRTNKLSLELQEKALITTPNEKFQTCFFWLYSLIFLHKDNISNVHIGYFRTSIRIGSPLVVCSGVSLRCGSPSNIDSTEASSRVEVTAGTHSAHEVWNLLLALCQDLDD